MSEGRVDAQRGERLDKIRERAERTQALAPLDRAPIGEWPMLVLEVLAELDVLAAEVEPLREAVEWLWRGEKIQGWEPEDHPRRQAWDKYAPVIQAFLARAVLPDQGGDEQ